MINNFPNDTDQNMHLLHTLKQEQKRRQAYNWLAHARPSQLMPSQPWNIWIILAGRGFGKTRTGAESIRQLVEQGYRRICLLGHSELDVVNVMLKGKSGLLNVDPTAPVLCSSSRQLKWSNGATALITSGCAYEQLRGPEFDCAWIDELAKFPDPQAAFEQLQLALRLNTPCGKQPKMIITTTPKSTPFLKKLLAQEGVYVTYGSTYDNKANLSSNFLQTVKQAFEGTRFGAQELHGKMVDFDQFAFCQQQHIKYEQINESECKKIVIALDPAASNTRDETGIIVCALDSNDRFVILEDASGLMSPNQWARKAVDLYRHFNANAIVAEVNQGGDMVETLIRQVDTHVRYHKVHATSSKKTRSQPIAALYEQGKVVHARSFPILEEQMLYEHNHSPDRLDALVWGITHLLNAVNDNKIFFLNI